MESVLVALIAAVPATIAALAAWRQVPRQSAGPSRQRVRRDVPFLRMTVIVLVGVVVAGGAGFVAAGLLDDEPTTTDVAVDGTVAWTDTGLDVAAGDDIEVTAGGEVFHREDAAIGPEGFPNSPDLLTPLPVANHAGLLARVGDAGVPFYVGRDSTFTAERDGRLYLGINDGGLENNRGFFTATITVRG